ncbi:MAG: hypothetical protein RL695_238 [Pseudomonadota bacterium]
MAQGVNLAIKLTFDGKEVTGGVSISRDDFRKLAVDAKRAGEAMSGGMTSAAQGVRSVSGQLDVLKNAMLGYVGVTQLASSARWIVDQTSAMTQLDARLFQSSPAIAGGRDRRCTRHGGIPQCFNPRPPLLAGATWVRMPSIYCSASFNPRPPLLAGATASATFALASSARFNPRPPLLAGATCDFMLSQYRSLLFQSSPAIAGGRDGA